MVQTLISVSNAVKRCYRMQLEAEESFPLFILQRVLIGLIDTVMWTLCTLHGLG